MATFTATANSASTIGFTYYSRSSWYKGTSYGACQGAYQETRKAYSRVGIMVFSGAGDALKGKIITGITLKITCTSAGSGSSGKVLSLHRANYQSIAAVNGSEQVGASLGQLTGKFYGNTTTHVLSASSNSALFEAMKAYLSEGNSAVVLYNGEASSSSSTYSANYARISSCTITVTYTDAAVWYNLGGTWLQCALWYWKDGQWIQVCPYYNLGGTWIRV